MTGRLASDMVSYPKVLREVPSMNCFKSERPGDQAKIDL